MRYSQAIIGTLVLAAILVAAAALYLFTTAVHLEDDEHTITNEQQTLLFAEYLLSAVKDVETGQRGFTLTGDEAYLEPYIDARSRLDSLLQSLANRLPDQNHLDSTLQKLIRQKLNISDSIIRLRRERGFAPAQAIIASSQGKRLMDSIRTVCKEIQRIEQQKVSLAIAESQSFLYNTKLTIAISASIVIALFLGAAVIMSRVLRAGAASNQALLEQKRLTDAILDTVPSFVYIYDVRRQAFDYANSFFEKLTGFTSAELKERGAELLWSRIHPDDIEALQKHFAEVVNHGNDGVAYEGEYRLYHKDGSLRWFADRGTIFLRDHDGVTTHILAFVFDITTRVHAEEERKRLEVLQQSIINTPLYGITAVEAVRDDNQEIIDFRFILLNNNAQQRFQRTHEELYQTTMVTLYPYVRTSEQFVRFCEVVNSGNSVIFEAPGQVVANTWITHACSKLNDGLVIIYYDTTDRKVAEEQVLKLNAALADKNADLERLVEERTAQLKHTNQELRIANQQFQEANKELEAFSYSVSHDLRAPLRSVSGFAEMLRERYKEQFDDEAFRLLEKISRGAQKMGTLIDELLALSRLGRKTLRFSDVDMTELVKSIVAEMNAHGELTEYGISISDLPNAFGDEALLRQVWVNLLFNAVKYSRHSASKTIAVTSFVQNGRIVYAIRDDGTGFDMRYADKLFQVFHRLHKESDFEGTGIGLAIVKRIISKHGGDVWSEAELNKGATFYFSLSSSSLDATLPIEV